MAIIIRKKVQAPPPDPIKPAKKARKKKAAKVIKLNPFAHIPDPFGYGQRAVDYLRTLKHPKSRLPEQVFPARLLARRDRSPHLWPM